MAPEERWLVAGLGNPGPWFRGTRHNAGFMVVDRLAELHGARFRTRFLRAKVAEIEIDGRPVVLAKPLWSINRSGGPIAGLLRRHAVPSTHLVVVQDELDFPFGVVRLKRGGGPGSHNGARSVVVRLRSRDHLRLRFGIGRPPKGRRIGDFVLEEFSETEQAELPSLLDRCADIVDVLVRQGPGAAQNRLHAPAVHEGAG